MVSDAAVKIKIMPSSPDVDLKEIGANAKKIIEEAQGKVLETKEEPVAFGLKAIILTIMIKETFDQDPLTESLKNIENVNSAEIIDFRRAGF
jgi:elongation factor 1-beta